MRRAKADGRQSAEWGITISSVEIRNIYVPKELQDALSKEAQAKREREARITLAEAERAFPKYTSKPLTYTAATSLP